MHPLHISTSFDAGAIEVISLADPQDIQLKIRPDNAMIQSETGGLSTVM